MESILTKHGLEVYHAEIINYIKTHMPSVEDHISVFPSYLQFPTIGKEGEIYIDTNNNKTYRWDDANIKYYCIGSDYNEIDIINGGGA